MLKIQLDSKILKHSYDPRVVRELVVLILLHFVFLIYLLFAGPRAGRRPAGRAARRAIEPGRGRRRARAARARANRAYRRCTCFTQVDNI